MAEQVTVVTVRLLRRYYGLADPCVPNRRVVLRLMCRGGFGGSVLDSLEYGFDVEVVGAVGVDVLESGGAYVG